jgi:hypothetical protein
MVSCNEIARASLPLASPCRPDLASVPGSAINHPEMGREAAAGRDKYVFVHVGQGYADPPGRVGCDEIAKLLREMFGDATSMSRILRLGD